jgi:hypothetical protein
MFYDMRGRSEETDPQARATHPAAVRALAMAALPDGKLLCGSTINAGTGGEVEG